MSRGSGLPGWGAVWAFPAIGLHASLVLQHPVPLLVDSQPLVVEQEVLNVPKDCLLRS